MRRLFVILATLFVLPLAAQNEDDARQFQKLAQVFRYLSGLYVDEVEMKPVVEGAITGMLEELDPHSAYIGAEEMKGVQESFDGEFSGIGVEFNVLRDTVIVVNTIAGGPAERVGVRANDRIVRIDTLDAVGMSRTDVPKHLRGKTGTKVGIDVVRHGTPGRLHFVIVRDKIPLNTVDASYLAGEGIGYIKVNRFGRTTMDEFTEAYRKLGRPEGLILDLRGNGGGLLEQAEELLRPLGVGRWAIVCDDTVAALASLGIGDPVGRDCRVDELNSSFLILKRLEKVAVNVDELDYLAKRLDSSDINEAAKFQAMTVKWGLFEMTDLINLTFWCQQARIITDFSDLEDIGRRHYMPLNGGSCSTEELERLDARKAALDLILNSESTCVTPCGVVYDNDMKLEHHYDGQHFPCYLCQPAMLVVGIFPKNAPEGSSETTWLTLPCSEQ